MYAEVVHLRYVVAAADYRSFRRAAAALNITQPTFSKRIRELEGRLGVSLFERSTGGVRITANGRDYVASARGVLAELARMECRAKAGKVGDAGRLNVGLYTSLSSGALRETILTFAAAHPNVEINLNALSRATLISLLDRGTLDITVLLGESIRRDFAHLSLWSDRIMAAFPSAHPLASKDFVYWTDIRSERFLMSMRDPGPEIENILLSKLASPGDRPLIKQVNAKREDVLSMISGNRGISLVCESATGNALKGVSYCEVRDGNGPTRVGFVAYWRHNNDNPALRQFVNQLQTGPAVSTMNGANSG